MGGNAALHAAGIATYGVALTAEAARERGAAVAKLMVESLRDRPALAEVFRAQPLVPPRHLFAPEQGLSLAFGGDRVEVFYPGRAHAPDNVVAWFPRQRILFGGCLILAGDRVGNRADADLAAWPASVAKLRRFPAAFVIPGHGERYDPELISHTLAVLAAAGPARAPGR